ncbi:GNAT family N-acetyltransferase [Microbacterium sp. AZCO]|uniref:GNAT family N-acetyltransferase n=1 Tax=Microbacterium sp. AZCO TaxID=3142976 RepID=UPI0031F46A8B
MGLPWDFHPLDGERVHLDLVRDDDFDALYALQSDPEVCRFLLFEPRSRDEVQKVLERDAGNRRLAESGDFVQPAIRDGSGELLGTVLLRIESAADRTAEIGWMLRPAAQGKGYAREAAALLLDLAFGELELHRVIAELDPRNAASAALCRRLEMRHEAHHLENLWLKGEWTDTETYAILDREWRSPA